MVWSSNPHNLTKEQQMTKHQEHQQYGGVDRITSARDWLRQTVMRGETADCPCCGRANGYELRLESAHAAELRRLFTWAGERVQAVEEFVAEPLKMTDVACHVPTELGRDAESYSQNCLSALRHFDLVQSTKPGWWKLTVLGRDFVLGARAVPRAAWVWRGERIRFIDSAGLVTMKGLEQHG